MAVAHAKAHCPVKDEVHYSFVNIILLKKISTKVSSLEPLFTEIQVLCPTRWRHTSFVTGPAITGHVGTNYTLSLYRSYLSTETGYLHSVTCIIKPIRCVLSAEKCIAIA